MPYWLKGGIGIEEGETCPTGLRRGNILWGGLVGSG